MSTSFLRVEGHPGRTTAGSWTVASLQAFLDSAREAGIENEAPIMVNQNITIAHQVGSGLTLPLAVQSPLRHGKLDLISGG